MNTIRRNKLNYYIYTTKETKRDEKYYTNRFSRFLIFPIKLKIINLYNLNPNLRWHLVKCVEKVMLRKEGASSLISEINKSLPEINNCGWTWRYLGIKLVPEKIRVSNQFKRIDFDFLLKNDLQYFYFLDKETTKVKKLVIYKRLLSINPKEKIPEIIDNLLNLSYLPDNSKAVLNYMKEDLLKLFISQINGWI